MANTTFFKKVDEITWKEIFSESFKHHSKEDFSRAMAAGGYGNKATESDMIKKWEKPWLWVRILGILVLFVILVNVFYYLNMELSGGEGGILFFYYIKGVFTDYFVVPAILPIAMMVFLWELNIPKNISFASFICYFIIGGFMSLAFTLVFSMIKPAGLNAVWLAPLTEEPGKLAASVVILLFFTRSGDKKLYGITGLVIGAAVGAGFSAMEDIQYVIANDNALLIRIYSSIQGHYIWAASYSAAVALNSVNGKLSKDSFLNRDFAIAFLGSCAAHALWNGSVSLTVISNSYIVYFGCQILSVLLQYTILLYMLKKCLRQIVDISKKAEVEACSSAAAASSLTVVCTGGSLRGAVWKSELGNVLKIGRSSDNYFKFDPDERGVSRNHCTIYKTPFGWALKDNNSSYGTFLNGDFKLTPGDERIIHTNDTFYLGSKENSFKVIVDNSNK